MNPPHTPYEQVPGKYVAHYAGKTWKELLNRPNVPRDAGSRVVTDARRQIGNYLAMVTGVDEQFGRILACLEETGLRDNTVVVFTSDHGNCIGSHNQATKNNPFDESLRIPFLVRSPGRIAPRVDNLLFGAADVMPTLLGLLGCEQRIPAAVEGTNFAPLFLGREMARPSAALYLNPGFPDPAGGERGVRTHRHTLVIDKRPGKPRTVSLYDNQSDPYQLHNLTDEQTELAARLEQEELAPLLRRIQDPWLEA
jgi:arylsulfatase A-like enzyme